MKPGFFEKWFTRLALVSIPVLGVVQVVRDRPAPEKMPTKEFSVVDYYQGAWSDVARRQNEEMARDHGLQQRFNEYVARFDQYKNLPLLEKAKMVDAIVDADMTYIGDSAKFGQAEYWTSAVRTFGDMTGDCEDYAILKYEILNRLRVPDSQLGVLLVPGHAVTLVRDVQGADTTDYILDNESNTFTIERETPLLTLRDTLSLKEYVAAGYTLDTISLGKVPTLADAKYEPECFMNGSGVQSYHVPVSAKGSSKVEIKLNMPPKQ